MEGIISVTLTGFAKWLAHLTHLRIRICPAAVQRRSGPAFADSAGHLNLIDRGPQLSSFQGCFCSISWSTCRSSIRSANNYFSSRYSSAGSLIPGPSARAPRLSPFPETSFSGASRFGADLHHQSDLLRSAPADGNLLPGSTGLLHRTILHIHSL